jgi:hypothetical protein
MKEPIFPCFDLGNGYRRGSTRIDDDDAGRGMLLAR